MNKKYTIKDLSEHLFWDMKVCSLDKEKNKTIIIERVYNRGDINDVKAINQIYGIGTIKNEIVKAGFLNKKTFNWVSTLFNIPKENFKCYNKIYSKEVHWNF